MKNRKLLIILGILGACIVVCLVLAVIGSVFSSTPEFKATQTAQAVALANAQANAKATADAAPTDQPAPTNKPVPTIQAQATPKPQPTDAPQPLASNIGKVGQLNQSAGISVGVASVTKVKEINQFLQPKAGNVYLVLDVVVGNVDRDEETPYNPFYFKVKDSNGFEYPNALLAPDPSLQSGTLAKGDKVRGNVAFEVKANAKGFVMTYEPLVLFGGYDPIRIDLGQ